MSNQQFPPFDDTISEPTAVAWTTNWRNYISNIDPNPNYIKAFNVPMEDILELANNFGQTSTSVRAYLAMESPGEISTLKIILVPIDSKGNDILSVPVGSTESIAAAQQSSIFDFTSPCPNTCDVDSPLFS
jgi:hypothetical protein